jgi:hypothetical protein
MGNLVTSGAISKGVIHKMIDDLVNESDSSGKFVKRDTFLKALRQATSPSAYLKLLEEQAGATRDQITYLRTKFYSTPNAWRADGKSVYTILQVGLIKALEEASDTLPLDSYWLAAAGGTTTESIICKSATQVTRIFLTPPVPMPRDPRAPQLKRHTPKPMWVVAPRSDAKQKKGFETNDAIVTAVGRKVVTWQRREFP